MSRRRHNEWGQCPQDHRALWWRGNLWCFWCNRVHTPGPPMAVPGYPGCKARTWHSRPIGEGERVH